MGRPKKPTSVLAASGAFDKNPARAKDRGNDLETTGALGDPPPSLSAQERAEWTRVVSFYPPGTLKSGHWYAVLTLAQLGAATIFGDPTAAERAQFKAFLSEMGLTLKSAANVQIPRATEANPFSSI